MRRSRSSEFSKRSTRWLSVGVVGITLSLLGCTSTHELLGAALAYRDAPLPASQTHLDQPYRTGPDTHPDKHRLDLYTPAQATAGAAWPTLIMIHGGGWTHGDRAMGSFGIQPMRNIGRFYAARGFGVVVISYRLQPEVTWRDQLEDVARATDWVRREIGRYGGDPDAIFLAGHSAGAWLAAWAGLNAMPFSSIQSEALTDRSSVCGLVLVSGAGYDLTDEETYARGAKRSYFEDLFGDDDPGWEQTASIRQQIEDPIPPTLILSGEDEPFKFHRQGEILETALRDREAQVERIMVSDQNHQSIAVSMSLEANPVSKAILEFLADTPCPRGE